MEQKFNHLSDKIIELACSDCGASSGYNSSEIQLVLPDTLAKNGECHFICTHCYNYNAIYVNEDNINQLRRNNVTLTDLSREPTAGQIYTFAMALRSEVDPELIVNSQQGKGSRRINNILNLYNS